MIEIREVKTAGQMRDFVNLPKAVYRDNPYWVPPIWMDERGAYKPKNNPILAHSDYVLHLACDAGKVVGRNIAYVDREFNKFYGTRKGFFGAFETFDREDAAKGLLNAAEGWMKARGMTEIRGPIHPAAEVWGFLAERFDESPIFLSPYNPEYYCRFMDKLGFGVIKRLLVYFGDSKKYSIPERFLRFTGGILERKPNITVRPIDVKDLKTEAEHIWRISNASLADNWGYVPVEYEVMVDMLNKVKPLVNADSVCFVEDNGKPVGYAFGFLDLNVMLKRIKGRLLPFGFVRLLAGLKRLEAYRLFGLAVMPEYHSMGLDVLLYVKLFEALTPRGASLEANYILEDNFAIRNALEKLGLERTKSYNVYEKSLV